MKRFLFKTRLWFKISLINFCVVAFAGVILRYKINFSLPIIDQKNLLHAHSHFAFTGWITLILMTILVKYLLNHKIQTDYKKYHLVLAMTCITAYGMLITFTAQGYALYSIIFSTASIFASYFFIIVYWQDLRKVTTEPHITIWFKTALVLWAISSLGPFALAYLMANHISSQAYYFASIYFFLHFQYNGFFLFVCFGLLFSYLSPKSISHVTSLCKRIFSIMVITVGPTYFLSILWLKLPASLHYIADFSGIMQLLVLFYFIRLLYIVQKSGLNLNSTTRYLWIMASIAFFLKVILQMLSIIPYLNTYAFSFRPIVIGYLHLTFLCVISFFIIGYMNSLLHQDGRKISTTGTIILTIGVLLQEVILMWQAMGVFAFETLPYAGIVLFYAAILITTGLLWITAKMNKKTPVLQQ